MSRPAHTLTLKEAMAELEGLMDAPRETLAERESHDARKSELELRILLLNGQGPAKPEPIVKSASVVVAQKGVAVAKPIGQIKPWAGSIAPKSPQDKLRDRLSSLAEAEKSNRPHRANCLRSEIRRLCLENQMPVPEHVGVGRLAGLEGPKGPVRQVPRVASSVLKAEPKPEASKPEAKPVAKDGEASTQLQLRVQGLQAEILGITAQLIPLDPLERAEVVRDLANLDALAHQAAVFAASGCIEVGA
jgi:hypothetical protein